MPKIASPDDIRQIQGDFVRLLGRIPDKTAKEILVLLDGVKKDLKLRPMTQQAIAQIPMLIRFFNEVLDLDRGKQIAELNFPEHEVFQTFMPIGIVTNHDEVMQAYAAKRKINTWVYRTPIASNIDQASFANIQKRPSGVYVIAHMGGDEPDQKHIGKSYDDSVKEKISFANAIEYLLMTGYHQFTKGHFMDVKGWTRTSDLWSDGDLVYGYWDSDYSRLYLGYGYRDSRNPGGGPRELVFS